MKNFNRNFSALRHPSGTKFLSRTREVGLFGNGNHCDFYVAELRSYSGDKRSIQGYYSTLRVAVPNAEDEPYDERKGGTQPVEVEFLSSPLPPKYKLKQEAHEDWNLAFAAGQKNLYLVLVLNGGRNDSWDSILDSRCF